MTGPTRGDHGDERRTDDNAQRIGADGVSRLNHDKLARADPEAPDTESQFRPSGVPQRHRSLI